MGTFLFRGYDAAGRAVTGAKHFSSQAQMQEYIKKRELNPCDIFESKTTYRRDLYALVSPKELSVFCKQMSVMFFSQITVMEGVMVLLEQADNSEMKTALTEIYEFMEKGFPLAEAMGMYEHIFSSYLINMVVIGEKSGTLDTVFSRLSDYYEKEGKIRKKIRSAITYPAILTALMAAIVVLLIVKILPMFADILASMGVQMEGMTAVILKGGGVLASYGWIILLAIAAVIAAVILYFRTQKGSYHFDRIKFKIPAYRFVTCRAITSRFARSLAILFKSGVQLLNALEDVAVLMDNRYLEEELRKALEKAKNREEITVALKEIGIFPPLFLKMFNMGERTGKLDEMLDKSASVFDDEVDDALERFTQMLEPVLIIVLSVVVGAILLSVVLPMIDVMNAIG